MLRQLKLPNFLGKKPGHDQPSYGSSIVAIATFSKMNFLLVCVPPAVALHFAKPDETILIFALSLGGIVPLAGLLSFLTDEISKYLGQTAAGLVCASLGNIVEMIVSIIALFKCELRIVQSSLVGSILSNLLLVLGMSFVIGAWKYKEQGFSIDAAQYLAGSLGFIAGMASLILAVAVSFILSTLLKTGDVDAGWGAKWLVTNRVVSVIMLVIYGLQILFQITHKEHLERNIPTSVPDTRSPSEQFPTFRLSRSSSPSTSRSEAIPLEATRSRTPTSPTPLLGHGNGSAEENIQCSDTSPSYDPAPVVESLSNKLEPPYFDGRRASTDKRPSFVLNGSDVDVESHPTEILHSPDDDDPKVVNHVTAWIMVLTVAGVVGITSEALVGSLNGIVSKGLPEEFVGIILLPIAGNAAEHATAVVAGRKDKLNMSINVAVGSAIQIGLFVIPLVVVIAWALGKPLSIISDPVELAAIFAAAWLVNITMADGKGNYYEGSLLIAAYLVMAFVAFFYPGIDITGTLIDCTV